MKKIAILILSVVLLGTMASCNGKGFTMQSTKTFRQKEYQMESLQEQFNQVKAEMQAEKDSIRMQLHLKENEMRHYKDSVAFMDLTRVMCYQNDMHRHSCEIYK